MPATRKSSRSSTGQGKQATLNFKNKVTKNIKSGKDGKDSHKSPSRAKEYVPEPEHREQSPSTPAEEVPSDHDRKLRQIEEQARPEVQHKSEAELRAEKISDAAIERYWSGIEASRMARAVHKKHTEGLTTGEKVLRYFDVSSQYGPCIGITRIKRWQRAQRLGLNPPIEVLAVLLKEEAKGNTQIERAHMDELLNSTAIGSV
ncbi:hypothetical protein VTK56DRAFT_8338 [Thermocarpiscus australiensis]